MNATVRPYRIALLNPNTNTQSTALMMASARAALPAGVTIVGHTVPTGEAFIASPAALDHAAQAVEAYGLQLAKGGFDAVIVAGFGDPGVAALRQRLTIPVIGLGEAGIAEAAHGGLRYAIVTVTPALHDSLLAAALAIAPAAQLAGIRYTEGPLGQVMHSASSLQAALEWSHQLLPPAAQRLLHQLAVFPGGFSFQAAELLVGPDMAGDLLERFGQLWVSACWRVTAPGGAP